MNSTVFNSTVAAASHRQEEKLYGDEIFRNIHALAMFHKPSDHLYPMLARDMFTKANTKAFAHVMHFLFIILVEPKEFRKKFFWPIIDKAGETNFRTAAMGQMNSLIQKHQLGLEPIKMHVVVLPGGLKFMKILYEFTVLAMRETIAKQSRGEESVLNHPLNMDCTLETQRCQQYFDVTQKIDANVALIQKALHKVEESIKNIGIDSAITPQFLESWQSDLNAQISLQIEPKFKAISEFAKQCAQLNEKVQTIASNRHKQFVVVDKDELKRCQNQLSEWLPSREMQNTIRQIFVSNEFNYSNLLATFEAILPTIVKHISLFEYRQLDDDIVQFESGIIDQMCTDVLTLKMESDAQLKRVETYFDYAQRKFPIVDDKENESPDDHRHHRFISTPPIRLRASGHNAIMHTHLPWKLENAMNALPSSAKKHNRSYLGTPSRSYHGGTPGRLNNSMNTSLAPAAARSNAITMLNMVRERCTTRTDNRLRPDHASNTLVKSNKKLYNFQSPSTTSASSVTTTTSSTATFYSGLTGPTRVFTEKLFESSTHVSPATIVVRQRCETSKVIHLQQQTDSKPIHDANFLRTSPSGRFIIPDSNPSHTLSLDDTAASKTDTTICEATPFSNERTVIEAVPADASNTTVTARKILFSPEASPSKRMDTIGESDETLFNVSDSVLQDVTI